MIAAWNAATGWPDTQVMSDELPPTRVTDEASAVPRLRVVRDDAGSASRGPGAAPPAPRPRTIGRLIAQTALIADSAVARRSEADLQPRGVSGRLLGRFR